MRGACAACLRRSALLCALSGPAERARERHGALDELFALSDGELVAGLTAAGPERERVEAIRRTFDARGARHVARVAGLELVCRHDETYPRGLREGPGPPAVLHVAGRLEVLEALHEQPAVAIVGARRASAYGLELARGLGRGLAAAGVTVISGMALGADSAAHAGALEAGGRTVAVLAGGADVPYPASKRTLHARIRATGCVVSEMPPGCRARRWCFPARNRIIAGLGALTVVVEAAERSGALITARVARELGRDVGAVPGRVSTRLAAGTNALIRDGAHLVSGPQDALDIVFGAGVRRAPTCPPVEARLRPFLEAIADGRDTLAALASGSTPVGEVMVALSELELSGHLRRAAGGRYVPVP